MAIKQRNARYQGLKLIQRVPKYDYNEYNVRLPDVVFQC